MEAMDGCTMGVDIGGTRVKFALLDHSGKVTETTEIASCFGSSREVVAAIVEISGKWRQSNEVRGLGVAVPALVERHSGKVLRAPNVDVLDGFELGSALEEAVGLAVRIDNDAHAAALAEVHQGAAKGCVLAVCLTVGTGVGGAIIRNGRLWRGYRGLAGEIGRLVLDPAGERCFEDGVSAGAVVESYGRITGSPEVVDSAEVGRRAAAGEEAAQQAIGECGRNLGVGLAICVNLLNPERIVIGGGVAAAGEWFLGPARAEGEKRATAQSWAQCSVVGSALGGGAGAIGAAILGRAAATKTTTGGL